MLGVGCWVLGVGCLLGVDQVAPHVSDRLNKTCIPGRLDRCALHAGRAVVVPVHAFQLALCCEKHPLHRVPGQPHALRTRVTVSARVSGGYRDCALILNELTSKLTKQEQVFRKNQKKREKKEIKKDSVPSSIFCVAMNSGMRCIHGLQQRTQTPLPPNQLLLPFPRF